MSHGLEHKFEMVSTTFRYHCRCANGEIITLTVALEKHSFDNRAFFLDVMERAYLDLQGEIEAHVKAPKRVGEPEVAGQGQRDAES